MSVAKSEKNLNIKLEMVWWIFTAMVTIAVIFPIYTNLSSYPFLWQNILFIIILITLTRFVFLLEHTILANKTKIKVGIVLISVPIIFVLIEQLSAFQTYMDEITFDQFMTALPLAKQQSMNKYLHSEMLFFGVGSIIISIIFPFRLVMSVWKDRNIKKLEF